MKLKLVYLLLLLISLQNHLEAQDTIINRSQINSILAADSQVRIVNLNPFITLHVDSVLSYKLDINKDPLQYYWFLRNAPVGLKINKDDGLLSFKAEKSFFLSGRLKYDYEYKVRVGVQNLHNSNDRVDTSFTLVFYNTEIIPSRVKPSVNNVLFVDEGDSVSFKVQCEPGSYPIENISTSTSLPINEYNAVNKCDEEFRWKIPFDFIKEGDTAKQRLLTVNFIGTNKFSTKDTATVRIYVNQALNYPQRNAEYARVLKEFNLYILQLKFAFKELDKKVKKTKNTRTTFDLVSGTTALGGTVFSTMSNENEKNIGRILPGVGVALVPVKEAVSPVKSYEQNSASLVRTSIRRLEYSVSDNALNGDRDPEILQKTKKLKDDLRQTQIQLIDIPTLDADNLSEKELNNYFNNPKVNKKYKVTKN